MEQTIRECLHLLEQQWYLDRTFGRGFPRLQRLWKLALAVRKKKTKVWIDDFELLALVYESLCTCVEHFDPSRRPKNGQAGRRSIADRFSAYFARNLTWNLKRYVGELLGDSGRKGDRRYYGPRGTSYKSAAARFSREHMLQRVFWAVQQL